MFAYCGNNPVRRVDHSGYGWFEDFWEWVKDSAEDAWEDVIPYLCTFKSNTREDFEQKVVAFFELLGD